MGEKERDALTNRAAYVVLAVWTLSMLADIVNPGYDPPTVLQVVMPILAAYLFGMPLRRGNGTGAS